MATFLKQFALGLGKAVVALVIVFGLFIGYVAYSERSSSDKAAEFCHPIAVGSSITGILERAISLGADDRQTKWLRDSDAYDQLPVTFTGATSMSRHICWVSAKDGRVVSRKVVYLD
jgi:hypothetical protein